MKDMSIKNLPSLGRIQCPSRKEVAVEPYYSKRGSHCYILREGREGRDSVRFSLKHLHHHIIVEGTFISSFNYKMEEKFVILDARSDSTHLPYFDTLFSYVGIGC